MQTKEERAAYVKEWRAKNKDKTAAASKKWRDNNKDKTAAYNKEYHENNKEGVLANMKEYQQTPKGRFQQHKAGAKKRGVEFLLTFKEWWSLWEPHWHQRGGLGHEMCMCRTNDAGPYAVGNVRIDTMANNAKEARILEEANR